MRNRGLLTLWEKPCGSDSSMRTGRLRNPGLRTACRSRRADSGSGRRMRQVQMGKAAIRAGIETLLAEYGGGDPEEILIAGGFGCRMDEEQTIRIGLFPEQFPGTYHDDWQQCACGSTAVSARRQDGGKTEACVYHRARIGNFRLPCTRNSTNYIWTRCF